MYLNYEIDDYLLIRNNEIIAISGNSDFNDVEEIAIEVKTGDSIVKVLEIIEG